MSSAASEVLPIRALLLKHPRLAWLGQDRVRGQWRDLRYTAEPDFARAVDEYDRFVDILRRSVPEVRFLPEDARDGSRLDLRP